MQRVKDKFCLVTAAAQGIGRASVKRLVDEDATVLATDIDEEGLASLAEETGCATKVLNVMDKDAIKAIAEEYPNIDVLFNCAGFVANGNILECDDKAWDFSFNLNVTAMYQMIDQ